MKAIKTRILFVDDEPQVLKILELILKPLQAEWDMTFCGSGRAALDLIATHPFEVLVSDMRMPGMSGVELLNEVMRLRPNTVRIILSGYADQETVLQCIGATHMYLNKPVEPALLKNTLSRIRNLNHRISNGKIRAMVSEMSGLPSIPAVYMQIMSALQSPDVSSQVVGEIVATDPALTAKVLQIANSAFFGSSMNVVNPEVAVQFLGVGIISALALTYRLFTDIDPKKYHDFQVEKIWTHSLQSGLMARDVMRMEVPGSTQTELAFTAGLLHDVGKLILLDNVSDSYRAVVAKAHHDNHPLQDLERAEYNVDHADIGGYLLGIWGLPVGLVEAVFYHHQPRNSPDKEFSALTAVHVANAFAQEKPAGRREPKAKCLDSIYLAQLGLHHRMQDWQGQLSTHH